eukprot:GHVL01039979.1.p1 GENE.GHVL01039979.1~~GHVL01039979.1.p1  ORF type:complete len:335 (-),score=96.94 GHVL01039979.1:2545-3549(-)
MIQLTMILKYYPFQMAAVSRNDFGSTDVYMDDFQKAVNASLRDSKVNNEIIICLDDEPDDVDVESDFEYIDLNINIVNNILYIISKSIPRSLASLTVLKKRYILENKSHVGFICSETVSSDKTVLKFNNFFELNKILIDINTCIIQINDPSTNHQFYIDRINNFLLNFNNQSNVSFLCYKCFSNIFIKNINISSFEAYFTVLWVNRVFIGTWISSIFVDCKQLTNRTSDEYFLINQTSDNIKYKFEIIIDFWYNVIYYIYNLGDLSNLIILKRFLIRVCRSQRSIGDIYSAIVTVFNNKIYTSSMWLISDTLVNNILELLLDNILLIFTKITDM